MFALSRRAHQNSQLILTVSASKGWILNRVMPYPNVSAPIKSLVRLLKPKGTNGMLVVVGCHGPAEENADGGSLFLWSCTGVAKQVRKLIKTQKLSNIIILSLKAAGQHGQTCRAAEQIL